MRAVTSPGDHIAELLDRAVRATNDGDLATAHDLAGQVLAEDSSNRDAGYLLATDEPPTGEVRRLTILACDLVGSTELAEHLNPEQYRSLVAPYRRRTAEIVEDKFGGHILNIKGDGILAVFGYPVAHEDDAGRGVQAALEICRAVLEQSVEATRVMGEALAVRAAVHRGLVYVDVEEDDVYGLAANVAARLEGLATPGTVVVSDELRPLIEHRFDLEQGVPQLVKGVAAPIVPFTVLRERPESMAHRWGAPLVGRADELATLRDAWQTALADTAARPTSVLLRGDGGIGKSRLAAHLADEARADRAVVVELTGSSFHTSAAFHPVQRLLQARCGIAPDAEASERLARLRQELGASGQPIESLPLLAPVLGIPPEAGYTPAEADGRKLHDEIIDAALQYLISCFGGGPGVLLVEDVQWFDDSTLELMGQLLQQAPGHLLVLLTAREGAPVTAGTTLDLSPLSASECTELAEALDEGHLDAATRQTLVARSDGIPLYLEELMRGASASGGDGVPASAVPDVLYEPLIARLCTRTAGVPVASAAATIGRDVDRRLLADTVDVSEDELDAELEALTAGRVLARVGTSGEQYRFRHELLREVAYDLQPPSRRRQVHARVADLLVSHAASDDVVDWPVVARHFEQAGRTADAADAFEQAADRARARGALPEARGHLGRAIALVPELPEGRPRMQREVGLRLRRGFLAMSAEGAGSADAATDFARCLEVALGDAQGDEMFSTLISLWAYHLSRAELDRARQVLETLRSALTGSREYFRATNLAGFGMIQWFEGDFPGALEVLERAMADVVLNEGAPEVDRVWFVPNDPIASIHTHLALARFMRGDTAGAVAQLAGTDGVAADLPFPQGPWSRAYGLWLGSWMHTEAGDHAQAKARADELVELAARHGFDSWTMIGMTQQAAIPEGGGAPTPEGASVQAATLGVFIGMWQMVELLVLLPYYLTVSAQALAASGDLDGARARCAEASELATRTGMRFYDAETARVAAALSEGDDEIEAALRAAHAIARRQGARPFELRIALDLHDLVGDAARPVLEEAVGGFATDAVLGDLERARQRLASG